MRVPWDVAWVGGTVEQMDRGAPVRTDRSRAVARFRPRWRGVRAGGITSGVYRVLRVISKRLNRGFGAPNGPGAGRVSGRRCPEVVRGCHAGRGTGRAIH